MANGTDSTWHLDKRVNVSIIAGLILQVVIFTGFIVGLDWRVKALEKTSEEQRMMPMDLAVLTADVGTLKEDVRDNADALDRIEDKIDRSLQSDRP